MDSAINALTEMDRTYEENKRTNAASLRDDMSSDQDSFVSATDVRNAFLLFGIGYICSMMKYATYIPKHIVCIFYSDKRWHGKPK